MRRVIRVTAPPEYFLVAIERRYWAFNEKHVSMHRALKEGDIIVFHAQSGKGVSSGRKPAFVGYGVVGDEKGTKAEYWWPAEIEDRKNLWPNTIRLKQVFVGYAATELLNFSDTYGAKPREEQRKEAIVLVDAGYSLSQFRTDLEARTGASKLSLRGSLSNLDNDWSALILGLSWFPVPNEPGIISVAPRHLPELVNRHDVELSLVLNAALGYVDIGGPRHVKRETKVRVESRLQKSRVALLEKFTCQVCGYRCVYEDSHGVLSGVIEVDHIEAKANGGTEMLENLWALCPNCHCEKTKGLLKLDTASMEVVRNGKRSKLYQDFHLEKAIKFRERGGSSES